MDCMRVEDAVLYVISLSPPTAVHLNKILWFADKQSYKERQLTVTNTKYMKNHYGPTIRGLSALIDTLEYGNGFIKKMVYSNDELQYTEYILLDKGKEYLDSLAISDESKKYIDAAYNDLKSHSATYISDKTHDDFYDMTPLFADMPIELTTVTYRKPSDREIQMAERRIEELNRQHV